MSSNVIKSNTSKLLRKVEKMINFNFPENNKKRFIYFSPNGSLTDKAMNDSIKSFFIETKNMHNKDLAFGYNLIFKNGTMKDLHNYICDNDLRKKDNLKNNNIYKLKKSSSFNWKNNKNVFSNMKNSSTNLLLNNFTLKKINVNKPIYNNAFDINKELDSFISLSPTKRIKMNSNENNEFNTSRLLKNKLISSNSNKNNKFEDKNYFKKINWSNLRKDINLKVKSNK